MQGAPHVLQRLREMAHGTQEHHDALFAGRNMGGLLGHFGHPHGIQGGIKAIEGRRIQVELIAQHHDQVSEGIDGLHGVLGLVALCLFCRHASEQYSTSAQFLAQALRHVMGRAHTAQGLLGRDCLLPLKAALGGFFMPQALSTVHWHAVFGHGLAGRSCSLGQAVQVNLLVLGHHLQGGFKQRAR